MSITANGSSLIFGDGSTQETSAQGNIAIQFFTTAGTTTWTPKGTNLKSVKVTVLGAGGGGGGGDVVGGKPPTPLSGGDGGSGGGVIAWIPGPAVGNSQLVTVGAGGSAGASVSPTNPTADPGTAGGSSSFGTFVTATAGAAGAGSPGAGGGSDGAGGSGSVSGASSSFILSGQPGSNSQKIAVFGLGTSYPAPLTYSVGGSGGVNPAPGGTAATVGKKGIVIVEEFY